MHTIGIIGAGNMGAILAQQSSAFFVDAQAIYVADRNPEKLECLKKYDALVPAVSADEVVAQSDLVFLAVKPQKFSSLVQEVASVVREDQLFVSIMAGIPSERLQKDLRTERIVRAMPNTPTQKGKGVIGWLASASVSDEETAMLTAFFQRFGIALRCNTDDEIDKVTAVSATGPAYFYYVCECLIAGAQALGFSQKEARALVLQTLDGAAALLAETPDPAALREQVTSKQGTTDAAISYLESQKTKDIFAAAIKKAYHRAQELSQ